MKTSTKLTIAGVVIFTGLYVWQCIEGHPERWHLLMFAAMIAFAKWFTKE